MMMKKLLHESVTFVDITAENEIREGAALWNIFRREDTQKLETHLMKHTREFRHFFCSPVGQVQF